MSLEFARVAAVHPEDHSVDLVMIRDGSRIAGVQVLSNSATTNSGTHDLPTPSSTPDGNKWNIPDDTDRDMYAVVGRIGRNVVVLGFLYPQVCAMLFKDANRRVMRHASDVYSTIDGQGNAEFYHPSGAYIRVGTSPAHEDLTGKDVDGNWKISKNTGNQVHIHVQQAGNAASLDIAPNGDTVLNTNGVLTVAATGAVSVTTNSTATVTATGAVAVHAPSVTLDALTTTCTGALTVQGLLTFQAGMTGSGGSGAAISGNITVTGGNVTADGKSLKTHVHSGVSSGGSNTGTPV